MKPTVTGYYWFKNAWKSMRTDEIKHGPAEIVKVSMSYTLRNRVVPHVIGFQWCERLDKINDQSLFDGPIACPWKEAE